MFKGIFKISLAMAVSVITPDAACGNTGCRDLSLEPAVTRETEVFEIYETSGPIIPLPEIMPAPPAAALDTTASLDFSRMYARKAQTPSIYSLPYSMTLNVPDWKKLWINSAVFAGAFFGTLFTLQCLPEDATSWNRASLQEVAPAVRWRRNVFERGPEWDHDKFYFNYILHPYAGAVYFMAARSAGFNFWRSFLYCSIVSNIGWEYGVEACMERPSYQDMVITPVVGSVIGECFYRLKRRLVADDYHLLGSKVVGNIVAFFIDPVNEVTGIGGHNPARNIYRPDGTRVDRNRGVTSTLMPMFGNGSFGFSLTCTF